MNTTTKTKSSAKWSTLTPAQQSQLEHWLFEDNLGYDAALEKAKQEFGFTGSRGSLQRFADQIKDERMTRNFQESAQKTLAAMDDPCDARQLQDAAVTLASQQLLLEIKAHPDEPKRWLPIANWVAKMARIASAERMKRSDNELRYAQLKLARRKFEHDVIETGVRSLKELQAVADARKEPRVRVLEYNRRMNRVRRRVFGYNIPDILPETEAELDAAEEAKRRQEEADEAYHNKLVAEYEAEQAAKGLDFHGNPLPPSDVQAEVGTSRCDVLPQEPSSSTESTPSASVSDAPSPAPSAPSLDTEIPGSKDLTDIDRQVTENIGSFSSDDYTDDQVDKDNQALGLRVDVKVSGRRRSRS